MTEPSDKTAASPRRRYASVRHGMYIMRRHKGAIERVLTGEFGEVSEGVAQILRRMLVQQEEFIALDPPPKRIPAVQAPNPEPKPEAPPPAPKLAPPPPRPALPIVRPLPPALPVPVEPKTNHVALAECEALVDVLREAVELRRRKRGGYYEQHL